MTARAANIAKLSLFSSPLPCPLVTTLPKLIEVQMNAP